MTSYAYQPPDGLDGTERPFCSCCRFTHGIDLPSPREIAIDEIQIEAHRFSTRVLTCWDELKLCLERFDAVIQKRWFKKSTKQRHEILLRAWPSMSREHRPDFMGTMNRYKSRSIATTRRGKAFLWPYINLRDLEQAHLLPLFLTSRGRNHPQVFVDMDLGNAHRGHGWPDDDDTGAADGPGLIFAGGRTPDTYGRLGAGSSSNGNGSLTDDILYPTYSTIVGLFILEVQNGIYSFLLECCKAILHDIPPCEWSLAPIQPAPPVPTPLRAVSEWQSTPAIALESPYRAPFQFDLDRFKLLVDAKRGASEDHISMMRNDPEYFLTAWCDARDHVLLHPETDDKQYALGTMMADAWCTHWMWVEIDSVLGKMAPIEEQLQAADAATGRLQKSHERLWARIDSFIRECIHIPRTSLVGTAFASPRIARSIYYSPRHDGMPKWYPKPTCSAAEYRVHVLISAIGNPKQRDLNGAQHVVEEFQNVIDGNDECSSLIDSFTRERFSDFALLVELQRAITTFQPWARGWRLSHVDEEDSVSYHISNAMFRDCCHHDFLSSIEHRLKRPIGSPLDEDWSYPADKKPSKVTTDQMRKVESRLKRLWGEVDEAFSREFVYLLWPIGDATIVEEHRRRRTKKWIEPEDLPAAATTPPTSCIQTRNENVCHTPSSENKKSEVFRNLESAAKDKVKTRGSPTDHGNLPLDDDSMITGPENIRPGTVPTLSPDHINNNNNNSDIFQIEEDTRCHEPIQVSKRTLKVFNTLLPPPDAQGHIGKEISWEDLLYAMNDVGLRPEKLYGSVWIFRPVTGEPCRVPSPGRSIQFHEPKEVRRGSKIPHFMCRTYGRRLKHAFGWKVGMFCLA